MIRTLPRAAMRPDPTPGSARTAHSTEASRLPEPSGLTQDEIRQIILELIG